MILHQNPTGKYLYAKGFSDGSVAFNDTPFKAVAATAGICPTHYFHRIHNSPICDVKIVGESVAHFESTRSRYTKFVRNTVETTGVPSGPKTIPSQMTYVEWSDCNETFRTGKMGPPECATQHY